MKTKENKTEQLNLMVTKEFKEKVALEAERLHTNKTQIIIRALVEYFDKTETND